MPQDFGVEFRCVFGRVAEEDTLDCFIDLMESRGWRFGGGWTPEGMEGVVEFMVSQREEAERCKAQLLAWLDEAEWVASVARMDIIDVNEDV